MKKLILLLLLIYGLWTICGLAYAEEHSATKPTQKLGRGLVNLSCGWMEVPIEIAKQTETKGHLAGLIVAPLVGVAKAIGRTLVGAFEIVTFPVPESEPITKPEYVWQRMSSE